MTSMSLTHWLHKKTCCVFFLPFQTFSHNNLSCFPISLKLIKSKIISALIKINLFAYSKLVWLAVFPVVWTRRIRIIREAEKKQINILNKVGDLYDRQRIPRLYQNCVGLKHSKILCQEVILHYTWQFKAKLPSSSKRLHRIPTPK